MPSQSFFDADWKKAEKKVDPEFDGSSHQALGFDRELCPTCGAHLHRGICLNLCHLSIESRKRFQQIMSGPAGKGDTQ